MLTFQRWAGKAAVLNTLLLSSLYASTFAQNTTIPSSTYIANAGSNNVSVAINVPEGTDKQDLYFHFEAPSSHSWVGLGIGTQMAGSLMFVMYRSGDNTGEPTVSPRETSGHVMPQHTSDTNITILSTSMVTDDRFYVDFHCLGCRQWNNGNGNVDVTSDSAGFFYALGPDGTLQSDDVDAQIGQHPGMPTLFTLDLKSATGANGVPSMTSTSNANSSSDGGSTSSSNGGSTSSSNGGSTSSSSDGSDTGFGSRGLAAHAFVMGLAFALIYPLGYLVLRLFERVWLHWGVQSFGVFLTILGVGAGIAVSINDGISPNLTHPHQIIGLLTFIIILAAWTLGLVGHMMYKKKGIPSPLMKGHRIAGPLSILLGFINACIGLAWAGRKIAIAGYTVFSLLVWIVVLSLVFWKKKRNMRRQAANSTAAQNFRDGQTYAAPTNPPAYPGIAMQNMDSRPAEYYSVQPNKP